MVVPTLEKNEIFPIGRYSKKAVIRVQNTRKMSNPVDNFQTGGKTVNLVR